MTSAPDVWGLVLAGGRSRRMGLDKATIAYHGRPQVEVCFELLQAVCPRTYLSLRPDQSDLPAYHGRPQLTDRYENLGPLGGLLTAFDAHPDRAWLVVACDLPFLDLATLQHLLAHRDPASPATAYRGAADGLPEPLCAIYEPAMAERLRAFLRDGLTCPRKALLKSPTHLLDLPAAHALDNANRPEDRDAAQDALRRGGAPAAPRATSSRRNECDACAPNVTVRLYASLREAVGAPEVRLGTSAATVREVYADLRGRFRLPWPHDRFRGALNDEFVPWDHPVKAGDVVSFIPPVAGG